MTRRALLAFALLASTGAAQAAETTPPALLTITTFQDAGEASGVGRDGKPLNVILTERLRKVLLEKREANAKSKPRYTLTETDKPRIRLTLEGELSHAGADSIYGGSYLCFLRLYREPAKRGQARRLMGQWAGSAQTLRALTANLRNDSGVDPQGLIGELAGRVDRLLAETGGENPTADFAQFLESVSSKRLTVDVVSADAPERPLPKRVVKAGAKFHLRITSPEPGSVYVVALDRTGKPSLPFTQENVPMVELGKPLLLPTNVPLTAPDTPGTLDYVVLVRRPVLAGSLFVQPTSHWCQQENGPSVQVIDATPSPDPVDPVLAPLLSLLRTDPPGTFTAVRVRITVEK